MSFEPFERAIDREGESADFSKLVSELATLKESIESIISALNLNQLTPKTSRQRQLGEKFSKAPILLSRAKHEIWEIRERRRICSDLVKSSIAWDMMLELYVAALHGRRLRTKNLLLSTIAPETTALRWIMFLEEGGYILRAPCPTDGRVTWITMTEETVSLITDWLEAKYEES